MYSSDTAQSGSELFTIANALQLALLAVVVVILAEFALAILFTYLSGERQPEPVTAASVGTQRTLTLDRPADDVDSMTVSASESDWDSPRTASLPEIELSPESDETPADEQHLAFARWLVEHDRLSG